MCFPLKLCSWRKGKQRGETKGEGRRGGEETQGWSATKTTAFTQNLLSVHEEHCPHHLQGWDHCSEFTVQDSQTQYTVTHTHSYTYTKNLYIHYNHLSDPLTGRTNQFFLVASSAVSEISWIHASVLVWPPARAQVSTVTHYLSTARSSTVLLNDSYQLTVVNKNL